MNCNYFSFPFKNTKYQLQKNTTHVKVYNYDNFKQTIDGSWTWTFEPLLIVKLSLHLRYPTIPGTWPLSDRGRRTSPARAPRPPWRSSGPSPSSSPSRPFSTPPLWATGRICWDRERPASWSGLMEIPGWIHYLSTPTRTVLCFFLHKNFYKSPG